MSEKQSRKYRKSLSLKRREASKMIGLEIEIESRRRGRRLDDPVISFANIARILDKPYLSTRRKIRKGDLTVQEALKIFESINFKCLDKFEAFIYLFTEQEVK